MKEETLAAAAADADPATIEAAIADAIATAVLAVNARTGKKTQRLLSPPGKTRAGDI